MDAGKRRDARSIFSATLYPRIHEINEGIVLNTICSLNMIIIFCKRFKSEFKMKYVVPAGIILQCLNWHLVEILFLYCPDFTALVDFSVLICKRGKLVTNNVVNKIVTEWRKDCKMTERRCRKPFGIRHNSFIVNFPLPVCLAAFNEYQSAMTM